MTTSTSRRKFLKTGIITAAAVGITVCGGGTLALTYQPRIDQPSVTRGEGSVGSKILVAYATRAGSTAETAVRIGEMLANKNITADVLPLSKVGDLAPYQAVVLGSAIRMSNVVPEVKTFLEQNQAVLKQKPFHLFILCMTLEKDNEETRKTVNAYLDPVRALVKPKSEGLFAGVMDPGKLKLYERMIMKSMKTPVGDFRNWEQIQTWSEAISVA